MQDEWLEEADDDDACAYDVRHGLLILIAQAEK